MRGHTLDRMMSKGRTDPVRAVSCLAYRGWEAVVTIAESYNRMRELVGLGFTCVVVDHLYESFEIQDIHDLTKAPSVKPPWPVTVVDAKAKGGSNPYMGGCAVMVERARLPGKFDDADIVQDMMGAAESFECEGGEERAEEALARARSVVVATTMIHIPAVMAKHDKYIAPVVAASLWIDECGMPFFMHTNEGKAVPAMYVKMAKGGSIEFGEEGWKMLLARSIRLIYSGLIAFAQSHCVNAEMIDGGDLHEGITRKQRRAQRLPESGVIYKVVALKRKRKEDQHDEEHGLGSVPEHMVRGHFKDYSRTGLFNRPGMRMRVWCPAHLRGNALVGRIVKDYESRKEVVNAD